MNNFIVKFGKIPLGQRILFLTLIILALSVVFAMLLYQPMLDDLDNQVKTLGQLNEEYEKELQLKASQEEIRVKLAQLDRQLILAKEKLPDNAEVPSLLQRIHNQAKTAGLEINKFKREPDRSKDYYLEIPVSMELVGTYDELANFFFYVGRMTRIVNVSEIGLTRTAKGDLDVDGNLKVTAQAVTFMYNRAADQAAARQGPPGKPPGAPGQPGKPAQQN